MRLFSPSRQPLLRHPLSSRFALHGLHPLEKRQTGAIPPSAVLSRKGVGAVWGGVSRTGPPSLFCCMSRSQGKFLRARRGCQLPRERLTSGEVQETAGEVRETSGESGKLPGNPWIAVKCHSERTFGEVAEKLPGKFGALLGKSVWESEMVAANRVAAINPPIDDTDPIRKFSIDPGSHTDLQNPAEFSPKGKPIRNFSIDPTSSIRTRCGRRFCGRHFRDFWSGDFPEARNSLTPSQRLAKFVSKGACSSTAHPAPRRAQRVLPVIQPTCVYIQARKQGSQTLRPCPLARKGVSDLRPEIGKKKKILGSPRK